MNENSNGLVASVCVLFLIVIGMAGYTFTHQTAPAPKNDPSLGSLAGPDLPYPYFSFGGVREWAASENFQVATTSLCAIQSPAATTTLQYAAVRIDFATTSAAIVEIGNALSPYATTTLLARLTVPTNGTNLNLIATTTTTTLTSGIVPPLSWINVMIGFTTGTASAATAPTGKCSAVFKEI